jgi:hypothetical protein
VTIFGECMEQQMPQYSMTFDDSQGQVVNAENADLNSLTKKVLQSLSPAPVIGDMPDTYVKLPAGIIIDGRVVQDAEVQELTGDHEEKLAKARTSNNPAKYVNTLLLCGAVTIGSKPVTAGLLDSLLQGDLDMLMLGIRRATFGDTFEVFEVECPHCNELNDLELDLKNIPVKELEDPESREFLIDLRKGRKAKVQFPTGAVQNEIFKNSLTVPEMNSLTLAECVISFVEADGTEKMSNGLADVKSLGLADRNTLRDYIYDNQPGPRYDQVTAQCSSCEGEVPVPLNVGILFREL